MLLTALGRHQSRSRRVRVEDAVLVLASTHRRNLVHRTARCEYCTLFAAAPEKYRTVWCQSTVRLSGSHHGQSQVPTGGSDVSSQPCSRLSCTICPLSFLCREFLVRSAILLRKIRGMPTEKLSQAETYEYSYDGTGTSTNAQLRPGFKHEMTRPGLRCTNSQCDYKVFAGIAIDVTIKKHIC